MNALSLPIRHARTLLAEGDNVLARDEPIIEIASSITTTEVSRDIDATGLVLLPGIIDPQIYFREPELDRQEGFSPPSSQLFRK